MAKLKVALDYFPHAEATRLLQMVYAEFKEKGYAIAQTLFEEIFMRGSGYFCEWNDDVALMFIQQPQFSVGVNAVSEVLNAMFRRGILSVDMYKRYGILTSEEIQEVYFTAVTRRKKVNAIKEYLLISTDKISNNVNIISLNADIISENECINSQKKRKESKVKEKKVKESDGTRSPYGEFQNVFLTDDDFSKLRQKYPLDYQKKIEELSTYMKSNGKRYQDHYATLIRWIERSGVTQPKKESSSSIDYDKLNKLSIPEV